MNSILEFIQTIVSVNQAQALMYLILANLIIGSVAALKNGEFEIARFRDFGSRVIVVFGTYLAVAIASNAMADFVSLRDVAWGALVAYLSTKILDNVKDLLGIQLPESISKLISRSS